MKTVLVFTCLLASCATQHRPKYPVKIEKNFSPLKNLTWSLKLSNDSSPYRIWVSKRLNSINLYEISGVNLHAMQKSAKNVYEVLVVISQSQEVDIFSDLNLISNISRPVNPSFFRVMQKNSLPRSVQCDNEALEVLSKDEVKTYFCKAKGQFVFLNAYGKALSP